jgi:hypothetical protein
MTLLYDSFTLLIKPLLLPLMIVGGLYLVRFIYRRYKPSIKGALGEALVTQGTFRVLDQQLYRGFSDLYLPRPDGRGTTQLDHAVVSPFGIFVIETKNYAGWIYGSERQAQWTQTLGWGRKYRFQNPIRQNHLHIKALAQHLNLPESKFHSVIFFVGETTFKTELPDYVINTSLSNYITSHQTLLLKPEEVAQANVAIAALVARTDKKVAKREHLAGIEKRRVARA